MYAIKTKKGYLAVQGNECWFQDEPNGWALYATDEDAIGVGEAHHSMIGTKPDEGYTLEVVQKQTSHTPGPWHYVVGNKHHGPYVESGWNGDICNCYHISSSDKKPFLFQEEQSEANARLIAAAPDMLEALKSLVAHIQTIGVSAGWRECKQNINDAIAKATGKEQD